MATWIKRPEILSYIIDCYAGLDDSLQRRIKRRVFLWEDGAEIRMGNTEAFVIHLAEKFGLILTPTHAAEVHRLLRELGERTAVHKPHAAPRPGIGKFKQPDPDSWVVGRRGPIIEGEDDDTEDT